MTREQLNSILEQHKKWLDCEEGGIRANLRGANLSGANLDYSCLPLWCGSLRAQFDDKQIIQFVYHTVEAGLNSPNVSEDVKKELQKLIGLANRFHRVDECGKIEFQEVIS